MTQSSVRVPQRHATEHMGFRDVSLFCAWAAAQPEGDTGPAQPQRGEIGEIPAVADVELRFAPIRLARWTAVRVVAILLRNRGPLTLDELSNLTARLLVGAQSLVPAGCVPYYILHVGDIGLQRRSARIRLRRTGRHKVAGSPALGGSDLYALVDALEKARARTGLLPSSHTDGADIPWVGAAYFDFYSQLRRRRGYLILDPRLSVIVDGTEDDVRLLLAIAQQASITSTGLSPASYGPVLGRVTAWVANADIQATLDSLGVIDRAGRSATAGGVLLSLALTGFSTLLALTQLQAVNPHVLILPTALFAATALLYALYAVAGWRWLITVGMIVLILATALSAVILVAPDVVRELAPLVP